MGSPVYIAKSNGFEVRVQARFIPERSEPDDDAYVWAYHVRIMNHSDQPAQLRRRHWIITDANGVTQEVRGDGVVGEEPVIDPGTEHDYLSGVPLKTPSGIMRGSYQMESPDGDSFQIAIPPFALDSPFAQVH